MDTSRITSVIVAALLSINAVLCHVVSYPGHLTGAHLGHLTGAHLGHLTGAHLGHVSGAHLGHVSGAHLGLQRLPLYHLGKVASPVALSSSSSTLRQIFSDQYYPAPGYPGYPTYSEYVPYPVYPQQYPEYGQYPGSNQITHFIPDNNQQVPPNASISKLPPILEGFVQRIQNLLSTYNPENHSQNVRPVMSFLQTPNKPALTNIGWTPQYFITPTFTTQHGIAPQGSVSPTVGVTPLQPLHPSVGVTTLQPIHPSVGAASLQPLHPSVGVTTLQPIHTTLGVTSLHPLQPSFGVIPQQTIPPPTQVKPEQPIATQRPQPAATPSTTFSPSTIPSENKNNPVNLRPDNVGTNVGQGSNNFGLLPNRPFIPATQTPSISNTNQGNGNNNNNHNVQTTTSISSSAPTNGANQPGTFSNVPQTTPQTIQGTSQPQPQDNNKHIPANVDVSSNPYPQQPPQPISNNNNNNNNNNNSPGGGSVPSFSAYGAPDPLTSTNNQVGLQRPPNSVTSSGGVSYTIHSLTPSKSASSSPSNNDAYGAPDPFSLPPQGNRNTNNAGESLQTFGTSSQTNEIIALIRQYGLLSNEGSAGQQPNKFSGAGNSFSVMPLGSLVAPQQVGARYNYDQPAKPFRYPANYN